MTDMDYLNSHKRMYPIYSIKYNNAADRSSMAVIADESEEKALNKLEKVIVVENGYSWMKKVLLEKAVIKNTTYLSPKSGIIALQDDMLKQQYP